MRSSAGDRYNAGIAPYSAHTGISRGTTAAAIKRPRNAILPNCEYAAYDSRCYQRAVASWGRCYHHHFVCVCVFFPQVPKRGCSAAAVFTTTAESNVSQGVCARLSSLHYTATTRLLRRKKYMAQKKSGDSLKKLFQRYLPGQQIDSPHPKHPQQASYKSFRQPRGASQKTHTTAIRTVVDATVVTAHTNIPINHSNERVRVSSFERAIKKKTLSSFLKRPPTSDHQCRQFDDIVITTKSLAARGPSDSYCLPSTPFVEVSC